MMLSPKARKVLIFSSTILAACILSSTILTYLFFLSPNAKSGRQETFADDRYNVAKEIIASLSSVAEVENRPSGLKKSKEFKKSEGDKALEAAGEAKESYEALLKKDETAGPDSKVIQKKIKSCEYLIKAANNYNKWLDEASKGASTVVYTAETFEWQSKGLTLLNKAITEVNAGDNKKGHEKNNEARENFKKATNAIKEIQKDFRNHDIAELRLMIDLYQKASDHLEQMANAAKDDTDTYNKAADQLNQVTQRASKIGAKSPIAQDLDMWLEKNFYYEGGQLIFHYKRAVETWPQD